MQRQHRSTGVGLTVLIRILSIDPDSRKGVKSCGLTPAGL